MPWLLIAWIIVIVFCVVLAVQDGRDNAQYGPRDGENY
jgi:hypothetical protein